jgi:hypothetical protein
MKIKGWSPARARQKHSQEQEGKNMENSNSKIKPWTTARAR